jgi:hypothetical protein
MRFFSACQFLVVLSSLWRVQYVASSITTMPMKEATFALKREPLPCDQIRISREWPLRRRSELEFAI